MEKTVPELMAAISEEEWAQVPESVLKLIEALVGRMDHLEAEILQPRVENELLKEQLELCQAIIEHYPRHCSRCGAELNHLSRSGDGYRHQVVEVPPLQPVIIEHPFYGITCGCCGKANQAPEIPEITVQGGYGSKATTDVGLLSSQYRPQIVDVWKLIKMGGNEAN